MAPGEPAEAATSGSPVSGPPDAAAVCRALRLLRQLMDDMAPRDELIRYTIVLVDDLLPVMDDAIALLEQSSATAAPAGDQSLPA